METKDYITYAIMAVMVIAGVSYTLYDTGEELTCRTNKPIGWEITADHGEYVEAICPYLTKDPVKATCKPEFRSTASYERYGCQEVVLVINEGGDTSPARSDSFECHAPVEKGCTPI